MSLPALDRPWLAFDLGQPMQVLSWAINRPGFATAQRIVWREVRNADLPRDLNVEAWFARELAARGESDSVAFLTSRDVSRFTRASARVGAVTADCVATVGLSNAERVGHRQTPRAQDWGTINIALRLSCGMTQSALIEGLSIAAEARTAAVMDAGLTLPTGHATGTGTDCIAVAAPAGGERYAGLHTALGEALGAAVYEAIFTGARDWMAEPRAPSCPGP